MTNRTRFAYFLFWVAAFVASVYAMSNLMPLFLRVATRGASFGDGFAIIANLVVVVVSLLVLSRGIYQLDKRAGRIRNKVGWFE